MKIRRVALALTCLVLSVSFITASLAAATQKQISDSQTFPVRVDITSVSADSLVLGKATELIITGKVSNTSTHKMNWLSAEVWRNKHPLTTQKELVKDIVSNPENQLGARLSNEQSGNRQQLTRENFFAPGQTMPFTIRASVAELGFNKTGVYQIGVHIRALDYRGDVRTVGLSHWLLPVSAETPTHVNIICLSTAPSMLSSGNFLDYQLEADLPRLSSLITLAEQSSASFLLDPELYDELTAISAPHTVNHVNVPPNLNAAKLLARINLLLSSQRGYRLPLGNPDLTRSTSKQLTLLLDEVPVAVAEKHPTSSLPLAVVAPHLNDAQFHQITSTLKPNLVLTEDVASSATGVAKITPYPLFGLTPDGFSKVKLRGRQLAEDLIGMLHGQPVVRLISAPEDDAALSAHQIRLMLPDRTAVIIPGPNETNTNSELTQLLKHVDDEAVLVAEITKNQNMCREAARRVLISRSQELTLINSLRFLHQQKPLLPPNPVIFKVQPNLVMVGDHNSFPFAVTNNTSVKVMVKLALKSSNPQRLRVPTAQSITLGPGDTLGVSVGMVSSASGIVPISAELQTLTGIPLTSSQMINVTSSNTGVIGWIIIVLSAIVVAGSTLLRIRSVQKGKAARAA